MPNLSGWAFMLINGGLCEDRDSLLCDENGFLQNCLSKFTILYEKMFGKICSFAYLFYNFVI